MKQSLRHQKIIELVKLKGYASTEELVIELEVSPQTIRRDLNILAEQDLIRRHHGGAAPSSTAENSDYIERKQFFPSQKSAIAREVAKRIPNGASLTFDITMAGGSLRKDGGIIGEATVNFISQFRLDFGILGISAIDLDGSLLDYDYHEVQVKRAIIESSRQTLLATDHSKFSRQAIVRLGELKDVDYLFTDDVPKQIADYLENSNTKLVICK